jgi:protein SCO1/2
MRRPVLRSLATVVAVAGLSVGAAGCGGEVDDTGSAPPTTSAALTTIAGSARDLRDVSGLTLIDHSGDPGGEEFSLRASPGRLLLVYFGYLSCPDVCPLTMADTANALHRLGDRADDVEVAFVTVDPERDTGDRLRSYMEHFFPEGHRHGLRPRSEEDLSKAEYLFTMRYDIPPHEPGEFYAVSHTGSTYVVDDRGRLVWEWPFGTTAEEIATALEVLLDERPAAT